jgi:hypothetical protein
MPAIRWKYPQPSFDSPSGPSDFSLPPRDGDRRKENRPVAVERRTYVRRLIDRQAIKGR